MPTKKKPAKKKTQAKPALNKSEFIRSNPNVSVQDLITKAKKQHGVTITPGFVYTIRSASKITAKKGSTRTTKVKSTTRGHGTDSGTPVKVTTDYRSQFRDALIALGVVEGEKLFADVVSKMKAVK